MAKKETLSQFMKGFSKLDDNVVKQALQGWDKNTLLALGVAIGQAPLLTGALIQSGSRLKAEVTKDGIKSYIAFPMMGKTVGGQVVNEPYPKYFDDGTRTPSTRINPKATVGFLSKAVDSQASYFIKDLEKSIDKVWNKL